MNRVHPIDGNGRTEGTHRGQSAALHGGPPCAPPFAERPDRVAPLARAHFVDALRVLALGLLVVYHVGMYYVPWSWHVKSATPLPGLAPWLWLTGPWRMTLLFVVAGMALALTLARRADSARAAAAQPAAAGLLRERAARLLLPLLTGIVLIVPPQAYFEVRQFHGFSGGYLEFLRLYFSAHSGFCTPSRGCLVLPTWDHLWFLPYLFVYSALLLGLVRRWPALPVRVAEALGRLGGPGRPGGRGDPGGRGSLGRPGARCSRGTLAWLLLPLSWFALTRVLLAPHFGVTHALVDDVFAHAQFAFAFGLGVVLGAALAAPAASPAARNWRHIDVLRWTALLAALLAWMGLLLLPPGDARALAWSAMQWCAVLAALGFARRHLDRDRRWLRALVPAVFPVYLLHQTVTIVAAVQLAPLALPAWIEGPLLLALTFGVATLGYRLLRRVGVLRPWFGMAPLAAGGRRSA